MLGKKVGIDLGTVTTRIIVKGEGMIGSEPTAVAIRGGEVQAAIFGAPAFEAAAEDSELRLRRPIVGGEIVDATAARWLVNHAMIRAAGRQRIFKPDVVISVMSTLAGSQRRSLLEAAALAGARTVYLLDAPLASAMGAGMRLNGPNGHLVIDIGAGKTDIAALALEGTVSGRCLPGHGGERLRGCIADHVLAAHGAVLDAATIEELIASLARVGPHEERRLEVTGLADGREQRITITSTELGECLDGHVRPDPRGTRGGDHGHATAADRRHPARGDRALRRGSTGSKGSTAPLRLRRASRSTGTASPSSARSAGRATPSTTSTS